MEHNVNAAWYINSQSNFCKSCKPEEESNVAGLGSLLYAAGNSRNLDRWHQESIVLSSWLLRAP